jgi:mRNA interferase HicA
MKAEFTAIIEPAPEGGNWAMCPEIPGANGQGETVQEAKEGLRSAGCYLKREGSSHSLWINPKTGNIEAIPRHSEIKEPLAKKILKNLSADH